jgi:hypothetical protein
MRPAQSSATGMVSIRRPPAQADEASIAGSASVITSIWRGEDRIAVLLGLLGSDGISLAKTRDGLCSGAGRSLATFAEDHTGPGVSGLHCCSLGLAAADTIDDCPHSKQAAEDHGEVKPVLADEKEDRKAKAGHSMTSSSWSPLFQMRSRVDRLRMTQPDEAVLVALSP